MTFLGLDPTRRVENKVTALSPKFDFLSPFFEIEGIAELSLVPQRERKK